ncbi:MAG TPA: hypothetical protein VFK59_11465 [Actinomycetota bacterium]|nr:hypothetical protein [Actinomycetota bacterium]
MGTGFRLEAVIAEGHDDGRIRELSAHFTERLHLPARTAVDGCRRDDG